jgi:hypothetical protein
LLNLKHRLFRKNDVKLVYRGNCGIRNVDAVEYMTIGSWQEVLLIRALYRLNLGREYVLKNRGQAQEGYAP